MARSDWTNDTEASFSGWASVHQYAPKTAKTYRFMFFSFVNFIRKSSVRLDCVTQPIITEYLKDKGANHKTKETYLWLLSDIFNHMIDSGEMEENPAERLLLNKKKNVRGRAPKRIPVSLSEHETKLLVDHAKGFERSYSGTRRKCALLLLLGCGLRVSELCGLKADCLHLADENPYLTVIGKADKERSVPIPDEIVNDLIGFMDTRNTKTPIFLSSKTTGEAYTPIGLYTLVRREMLSAGVMKTRMSPHVLRHTYCTAQLANGVSLAVVKAWMGHDYISTTARYEHVQGARNGERPVI